MKTRKDATGRQMLLCNFHLLFKNSLHDHLSWNTVHSPLTATSLQRTTRCFNHLYKVHLPKTATATKTRPTCQSNLSTTASSVINDGVYKTPLFIVIRSQNLIRIAHPWCVSNGGTCLEPDHHFQLNLIAQTYCTLFWFLGISLLNINFWLLFYFDCVTYLYPTINIFLFKI